MREHFVIVGASLAGLRGAQALRSAGYNGRISVIGRENCLPYNRPPLSKKILTDEQTIDDVFLPLDDNLEIDWLLGASATALDIAAHEITLNGGQKMAYDHILIATGVSPAIPDIPGRDLAGVYVLRDIEQAQKLRQSLISAKSLIILGAGFIGCEVAASARKLGLNVVIIDPMSWPMNRVMGEDIACLFQNIHEERGVCFRMGRRVVAIKGQEAVHSVELDDGEILPADLVLMAVGSTPATQWLEDSGLVLDNGVVCDCSCLALKGEGRIAAAGDIAAWSHLGFDGEIMRMEHWTNAAEQGAAAALALIADNPLPYLHLPTFWSDQYEYKRGCTRLAAMLIYYGTYNSL